MSELKHLRCDRCTDDEVFDPFDSKRFFNEGGWARVEVGSQYFDICPNCWKLIAEKEDLKVGKGRTEGP